MKFLKLKTCELLKKIGCKSDSEFSYYTEDIGGGTRVISDSYADDVATSVTRLIDAFTWEDICITDNAKAIWGVDTSFFKVPAYIPEVHHLLNLMLEGKDWEECLLNQLKEKK